MNGSCPVITCLIINKRQIATMPKTRVNIWSLAFLISLPFLGLSGAGLPPSHDLWARWQLLRCNGRKKAPDSWVPSQTALQRQHSPGLSWPKPFLLTRLLRELKAPTLQLEFLLNNYLDALRQNLTDIRKKINTSILQEIIFPSYFTCAQIADKNTRWNYNSDFQEFRRKGSVVYPLSPHCKLFKSKCDSHCFNIPCS